MQLTEDASPELTLQKTEFLSRVDENNLFDSEIPVKYFEFSSNTVHLKPELATKINWYIDEQDGTVINIAAYPQQITINNQLLSINVGYFCSYISEEEISN
jgi:hypothetical protein